MLQMLENKISKEDSETISTIVSPASYISNVIAAKVGNLPYTIYHMYTC